VQKLATSPRLANVLLVDDDPDDAELLMHALKRSHLALNLTWVEDGDEALALLRREGGSGQEPPPDLVLLDLNMPRKSGHAVLSEIRADPDLRRLPVVVLTTSTAEVDVSRSHTGGASAYVTKPMGIRAFMEVLESLDDFRFSVVVRGPREP
jgi:chemotaxis family two-component system response regulator Rcp1